MTKYLSMVALSMVAAMLPALAEAIRHVGGTSASEESAVAVSFCRAG
jgi:hypothetical protein